MTGIPPWLDDEMPHEPEHDRAQRAGLMERLAPPPRRVLDLGCGVGRVLVPLVEAGHVVVGVDRNARALAETGRRLRKRGLDAELIEADFAEPGALPAGAFDAVLCLGNTFMTLADVDVAVDVLHRCAEALADGGVVIIDDLPADLWPELTGGNWQAGLSPDGAAQLVWSAADAILTIRLGADVDEECWTLRDTDQRLRLWTDGALRLAANAAGLAAPQRIKEAHLLEIGSGLIPRQQRSRRPMRPDGR